MKTIVAYANTSGGKIVIGVDDVTRDIVGVEPSSVFDIMDKLAQKWIKWQKSWGCQKMESDMS